MTGFSCERCENCVDIGAVCKSCKFKMSAEQIEMCELNNKMVEAALHSLKNASSTSVETQLAICEKMLELMDGIYYKHNVNLFTVLRNAMRCCLSLKRVVQALDYGEKLLKIQEFYQYPNDLSLLHMKLNLAKLYISQKEMKKAKAHLAPVMEVF
uniref:Uncharacterized protein n=1 Tax=Ditylenchus dipsaci TaxID=166011 RepID=A0A915DXI0_9BILA